ncbi:MAG: 30S ribosomal protein S12 methylthiotransferase RimO [Lachnospiraceae bacterium]|nr:30S ribosomal protein S12 methylthiotransferase RimO [Lachnospiraceae bacterium]
MKVLFVSLGCDKNSVDSEMMLGILARSGYEFTNDEEEADIVIINSCCFIGDAKEESINTIIEYGKRRLDGQLKALIVTGCLAQRYPEEIRSELPEVDALVGTAAIGDIAEVLGSVIEGDPKDAFSPLDSKPFHQSERIITTSGFSEYLKIAEGCARNCTYCIIPKIRGPYRSVPMEELVKEAESLAERGVREINIVAQEITLYGIDLYGKKMLPELLRKLCLIEDLRWIRLLYCYPEEITDELIEVIRTEKKVLHYIDMPVQSGSDGILGLMGRKITRSEILDLVRKIRTAIPDICIRTTLITGFPSESKKDFEETADLVRKARFNRLGCFTYSPEEGTKAAEMKGQISERTKEKRRAEIMRIQQDIVFEYNESLKDSVTDAFVEGYIREDDVYVCRTYMDAPDVDGLLFVSSERELQSGMIIKAKITGYNGYDLIGEFVEQDEPTQ